MMELLKFVSAVCIFALSTTNAFIGNNIFKTGDSRLFDTFCVSDVQGLDAIGRNTHTHKSITENGIKRSLLALFADLTPDYTPPSDYEKSTLTQIFQYDKLINI